MTPIYSTNVDGTISNITAGYCGGGQVPALYPGSWFQLMGTGGPVTIMACSEFNVDGFYFSVYNAVNCDSLECVDGTYELNVQDADKCTFGVGAGESRSVTPLTKYTFNTRDRDRYYIYVHFARTAGDRVTDDFRFFADDGKGGSAGSSGPHLIEFEKSTSEIDRGDTGNNGVNGVNPKSGANKKHAVVILTSMMVVLSPLITSTL
jgi:hypothetical protein